MVTLDCILLMPGPVFYKLLTGCLDLTDSGLALIVPIRFEVVCVNQSKNP